MVVILLDGTQRTCNRFLVGTLGACNIIDHHTRNAVL